MTEVTEASAGAGAGAVAGPQLNQQAHSSAANSNAATNGADFKDEGFQFIMRISCELGACGNIIGKGGEKIKAMTEASGAHISLSDYMKGSTHRTATVRGKRKCGMILMFLIFCSVFIPL